MPSQGKAKSHWSKNVRDVSVYHDSLHVRIEGGSENGEFLYVSGFTGDKVKYKNGRLCVGDILIELNDEPVVGLTLQDLMNRINQAGKKVNLKVVQPGGGISKDICDYLAEDFSNGNEVDFELQDLLKNNLYARTVPCTTRCPRATEEPGIDYTFVSKEEFVRMEENGDFLESGTYNGHYYGTLKPEIKVHLHSGMAKSVAQHSGETDTVKNRVSGDNYNGEITVHQKENHADGNKQELRIQDAVEQQSVHGENISKGNENIEESDDKNDMPDTNVSKELKKSESNKEGTLDNHFSQI